jgi:hypothetical protein
MKSSVGSTNDLKPEILSRLNFNGNAPPCRLSLPTYFFFASMGSMKLLSSA